MRFKSIEHAMIRLSVPVAGIDIFIEDRGQSLHGFQVIVPLFNDLHTVTYGSQA